MSITGGIIIYVNLWMIILFMVLPFGVTNQIDSPNFQKGTDPGAPVESKMKKKDFNNHAYNNNYFFFNLCLRQIRFVLY